MSKHKLLCEMASAVGGELDEAATSRLLWLLRQEVPVIGARHVAELPVVPWLLLHHLRAELALRQVPVRDMRLEGSAAALVLNPHVVPSFNDLDLVVHLAPASPGDDMRREHLEAARAALLAAITHLAHAARAALPPPELRTRRQQQQQQQQHDAPQTPHALAQAYLQNMFISPLQAPAASADAWALFTLCGRAGAPSIDIKFVQRLQFPYQFSVDSFQIIVDPALHALQQRHSAAPHPGDTGAPDTAAAATAAAATAGPPVVRFESSFGRAFEVVTHLSRRRLVVRRPADLAAVHGGGLLKYALLLAHGFSVTANADVAALELTMCTRFLQDHPLRQHPRHGLPEALAKLCAFIAAHAANPFPTAPAGHSNRRVSSTTLSATLPADQPPRTLLADGTVAVSDVIGVAPLTRASLFLHELAGVLARVEAPGVAALRDTVRILQTLPLLPLARFSPAQATEPALSAMFAAALQARPASKTSSSELLLLSSWFRHVPCSQHTTPRPSETLFPALDSQQELQAPFAAHVAGGDSGADHQKARPSACDSVGGGDGGDGGGSSGKMESDAAALRDNSKSTPRSQRRRPKAALAAYIPHALQLSGAIAAASDGEETPTWPAPLLRSTEGGSKGGGSGSGGGGNTLVPPTPVTCWLDSHFLFDDSGVSVAGDEERRSSNSSVRSTQRHRRLPESSTGLDTVAEQQQQPQQQQQQQALSAIPLRLNNPNDVYASHDKLSLTGSLSSSVQSTFEDLSKWDRLLMRGNVLQTAAQAGVNDAMLTAAVSVAAATAQRAAGSFAGGRKTTAASPGAAVDTSNIDTVPDGRLPTGVPLEHALEVGEVPVARASFDLGTRYGGSDWSLNSFASADPGTPYSPRLMLRGFHRVNSTGSTTSAGAAVRRPRVSSLSRSITLAPVPPKHTRQPSLPLPLDVEQQTLV